MKYPRTARIFRGQLDAAPFAGVFFLLLIFVLLASLVYTPGVRIELPAAGQFATPNKPTIRVAVDAKGRYFYENLFIEPEELGRRLAARAKAATEPLALEIWADKEVTQEVRVRLIEIGNKADIREFWEATMPRLFEEPGSGGRDAPQR